MSEEIIVSRTMKPSMFIIRGLRYQLREAILKSPESGTAFVHSSVGAFWINAHWSNGVVSVTFSGAHEDIEQSKITGIGSELQEGMPIFRDLYQRATKIITEQVIESVRNESQAHEIISGLAQKFNLIGCGYFTQEDVQRELEREMSVSEFGELKKDLHDFHDFAGTAQTCLSEILSNTI